MAISHFVDAYTSKGAFSPEKLQTSANVIKSILSTWTGLICFCMEDFRAIRAIVETMGLPHDETRVSFDMIGNTFMRSVSYLVFL